MSFWQALLASAGLTVIVTQGSLFRPLQRLAEFFQCSLCVGFWIGLAVSLLCYFTESLPVRQCFAIPSSAALTAHLVANFVAACWRVASEPIPPETQSTPPSAESEWPRME